MRLRSRIAQSCEREPNVDAGGATREGRRLCFSWVRGNGTTISIPISRGVPMAAGSRRTTTPAPPAPTVRDRVRETGGAPGRSGMTATSGGPRASSAMRRGNWRLRWAGSIGWRGRTGRRRRVMPGCSGPGTPPTIWTTGASTTVTSAPGFRRRQPLGCSEGDPIGRLVDQCVVIDQELLKRAVSAGILYNKKGTKGKPAADRKPRRDPAIWDAILGAGEWGKRKLNDSDEGKRRFHKIKQKYPGAKATDVYGVNPDTGDVYDPNGEWIGNLEEDLTK